jgi:hypothetical protein
MTERPWQLLPPSLQEDMRFKLALMVAHREIYDKYFVQEPMSNPALGYHLHGYRRTEDWRIILALTPWMLSRLMFPTQPPAIEIPEGWSAAERKGADYQLLGPSVNLDLQGSTLKAHLNYHPQLGHYLLQPIALNMQNFATSEETFEAWNEVIQRRDENMQRMQRECPWQQEVSRREFLSRLKDIV